jgi:SAM-dependent methyltransferase
MLSLIPTSDSFEESSIHRRRGVRDIAQEWEDHYGAHAEAYSEEADWWTLWAWRQYLFRRVLNDLRGKVVVDVGCGTAVRVATIAPIHAHGYRYIGIDSSATALKRARNNMAGGSFIQANLDALCLPAGIADIVLCLGVLMYFEDSEKVLNALLEILKPGGVLLLHEFLPRKSWSEVARRVVSIGRDIHPPPHGVHLQELSGYLQKRGTIVQKRLAGSPLRKIMTKTLGVSLLNRLRPIGAWCDSAWCATAGSIVPAVGASQVQIVFRKAEWRVKPATSVCHRN